MKLIKILGFLAVFPLLANASLITSGTITISGLLPSGSFNFSGSDFSASGGFGNGNWSPTSCFPCTVLSVNGTQVGNDFGGGHATIGATDLGSVFWGDGDAAGNSVFSIFGPAITLGAGPGVYHGTFTFNGSLCGTQGGAIPHPCVANLSSLTGSGTVDVNVTAVGGLLQYSSATYTFVVPEPATWMLVLGGIAVILIPRRRKLALAPSRRSEG